MTQTVSTDVVATQELSIDAVPEKSQVIYARLGNFAARWLGWGTRKEG